MNNATNSKKITIIGAGPVGSMLSIYLSKRGYSVEVYEKRQDLRTTKHTEGRSINLALSTRGLKALSEAGLEEKIKSIAVPMSGRMIHGEKGELNFQPYGEEGQFINSISRNTLNEILIEKAEETGVRFFFNVTCNSIEPESGMVEFVQQDKPFSFQSETIFGADGAFSEVRNTLKKFPDFTFEQDFLSHGYKELLIPSSAGKFVMEKNALHIWPREQFMLIALPNLDGSFTATLFLPFKGATSFETLNTEKEVTDFFQKFFPDIRDHIPSLEKDFFRMPASSLVTTRCFPWVYEGKIALIGDAAHAITPFYGQGMNAGFEDCRILNTIIEQHTDNWKKIFAIYQEERKENSDAIAELALKNFIEMRDLVGDEHFILRKKIEAAIHKKYPSYLPLYSMVTFSDLSYKEALQKGNEHDQLMEEVMKIKNIQNIWETKEGWSEIEKVIKKG